MIEEIKNKTPNFISTAFRKELDFTGLDEKGKVPAIPEYGLIDLHLPKYKDIKKNILFTNKLKQIYGSCFYYSINYIQREAMMLAGIDVKDEFVLDVDLGYTTRPHKPTLDRGTVGRRTMKKFYKKGLPISFREQEHKKNGRSYKQFKKDVYNKQLEKIVMKPAFTEVATGKSAQDLIIALDGYRIRKEKVVFRISIMNDNGVSVYHREVPKITGKVNYRGGAHSLAGIGSLYAFEFNGEPAFATYESTGSVNKHIWKLSVALRQVYKWEIYKVGEHKVTKPKKLATIKKGSRGKIVKLIQNALKKKGYLKIRKTTEYYGVMTERAVKKFQKANGLKVDGICGKNTLLKLL